MVVSANMVMIYSVIILEIRREIDLESATEQPVQGNQLSSLGAPMNLAEASAQAAHHSGSKPSHQLDMSDV